MVDDFKDRGGSPWGSSPGGGNGSGRGPTPPNIDEIIKNIQKIFNRFLPGSGAKGGTPLILGTKYFAMTSLMAVSAAAFTVVAGS